MAAPKTDYIPILAFVLDFETGGLNCQDCAVTQIAIHAIRIDNFEKIGSFVRYIYPYDKKEVKGATPKRKVLKSKFDAEQKTPMEYSDRALEVSGLDMETLYGKGEPLGQVAQDCIAFMRDVIPKGTTKGRLPIIVGQNITFDEGFLCQMFEYAGLMSDLQKVVRGYKDFYGNWHPQLLDTIHLGQLALSHNPSVNSFKLELMCEMIGVELDDAHDADADVAATTNVLGEFTKRMRSKAGVSDGSEIQINKAEKTRKHFKI